MDVWLQYLVEGKEEPYEELFKRYWRRLVFYATKFVEDEEDATDIVQGAFTALYERRGKIESRKHAINFMYLHTKRRCLLFLEAKVVEKTKIRDSFLDKCTDEKAATIDLDWVYAQIIDIIASLSPKLQEAILLRIKIGNITPHIKAGTEYVNVCRARDIIKKKLSDRLNKGL